MFAGGVTAKAETEDYVADSYLVEISETEVKLPVPKIDSGWVYSVALKSGETVLSENVTAYLFTQTGEYTLVYSIRKDGSLIDVITETATLRVTDTRKPTITTDGYDEEYFVGDTLEILSARVEDNVDQNLTASVELYCGEENIPLENGKHVFKKTGTYTLTYKATDAAGNEGTLTYEFTVSKGVGKAENGGCGGCSNATFDGSAIALGGALCGIFINRKAKQKNKKIRRKNDEN